jgi:hypothetical protein
MSDIARVKSEIEKDVPTNVPPIAGLLVEIGSWHKFTTCSKNVICKKSPFVWSKI